MFWMYYIQFKKGGLIRPVFHDSFVISAVGDFYYNTTWVFKVDCTGIQCRDKRRSGFCRGGAIIINSNDLIHCSFLSGF